MGVSVDELTQKLERLCSGGSVLVKTRLNVQSKVFVSSHDNLKSFAIYTRSVFEFDALVQLDSLST